jgi:hypothetical protein
MANARDLSILAQGASTAGILSSDFGGTGASLSPTTAGNTIFSTDGANWSSTQKIVRGTTVATTSGTSIDFTGIPSWVKRITMMFNGVSTNGTSNLLVQIGAGSVDVTGYVSTGQTLTGGVGGANASSTAGMIMFASSATVLITGQIVLTTLGSNLWVSNHALKQTTSACAFGAGDKTLSGTLDRVRLTTVNGTDTFDAGSINILYE